MEKARRIRMCDGEGMTIDDIKGNGVECGKFIVRHCEHGMVVFKLQYVTTKYYYFGMKTCQEIVDIYNVKDFIITESDLRNYSFNDLFENEIMTEEEQQFLVGELRR